MFIPQIKEQLSTAKQAGKKTVLLACEHSGTVSKAFQDKGCFVVSCDLLETEEPSVPHYRGNVIELLHLGWDLMIAHPPCTHLAVSGARWFKDKQEEQAEALEFVRILLDANIPQIALENPVSVISSKIKKPTQTIQPWQFGHGETKRTCLWLKGLPKLEPTEIVEGRFGYCHSLPPSADRWKLRSKTYTGIAKAMAEQWSAI